MASPFLVTMYTSQCTYARGVYVHFQVKLDRSLTVDSGIYTQRSTTVQDLLIVDDLILAILTPILPPNK